MRTIVLTCFLILLTSVSSEMTISEIRALFKRAATEEQACTKLIYSLKKEAVQTPVYGAYKASALMIHAKYVSNPLDKLSTFSKGKKLLEQTVMTHPLDLEIRFLRLTMQVNAPSFLGYNDAISRDKKFILENLKTETDNELKNMITSYLEKSDLLTKAEKKLL